jgi:hypothetical protein
VSNGCDHLPPSGEAACKSFRFGSRRARAFLFIKLRFPLVYRAEWAVREEAGSIRPDFFHRLIANG